MTGEDHQSVRFDEMAWLTPERAWLYGIALVIAWTGYTVAIIWSLHGGHDGAGNPFGADYASFWAASRLVQAGHPADVYLPAVHRLAELPVLANRYEAFFYPPPFLLLCIPLALLPYFPSLVLFLVVTGAAYLATIQRILRTRWAMLAALAFPAVNLNITAGQNACLTAAILGTGLTMLDRRPKLAGLVLGLMVIKPHLALAVPIALVLSRRWTVLLWAAASVLGLVALSGMLFGWTVWTAYLAASDGPRQALEQGLVGFAKLQSSFAFARWAGAGVVTACFTQAIVAAAAIGALAWARCRRVSAPLERSLIVLASLLCTPFLLFYDMTILALPLAWMLRGWLDEGFPRGSKLVLLVVFCLPTGNVLLGPMIFGLPALLLFGACLLRSAAAPTGGPLLARLRPGLA